MLSKDEKEKIRFEEEFRHLVRGELANKQPNKPGERIWTFFNSNLGLFLLSTVVIGLITWSAGLYEKEQRLSSEQREMLRKSNLEISFRISPLKDLVKNDRINDRLMSELQPVFGSEPPEEHDFLVIEARTLFPELKNRNLASLFYELVSLVEGEKQAEIKKAIEAVEKFERMIKTTPKKKIDIAGHVTDEIPDFSDSNIVVIKTDIIKAFQPWLDQ